MFAHSSITTIDSAITSSIRPNGVLQKRYFYNHESRFQWYCRSTSSNILKKESAAKIFSCDFDFDYHNTFNKEPRLLLHNHLLWLLSHHDLSPFFNTTHIFWLSMFLGSFVDWEQVWVQYFNPLHHHRSKNRKEENEDN